MNALKNILFKILRLIGIFALIYVCLLLYMVMSERRLAFPRAEIDDASESALRDNAVLCHVENDKKLQGWILNDSLPTTALYFADRGEDAATFLANAKRISGFRLVTFNYRGSAGSEGTPGEKYYDSDIRAMVGCAHSNDLIFIGHGTGAIAAYNSFASGLGKGALLVDPAESFSSALSARYRIFFPKFLSRTHSRMIFSEEQSNPATVIADDPRRGELVRNLLNKHSKKFTLVEREGNSLLEVMQAELTKIKTK